MIFYSLTGSFFSCNSSQYQHTQQEYDHKSQNQRQDNQEPLKHPFYGNKVSSLLST